MIVEDNMDEIINDIIALLGGVTVVLAALFGFIGKLWLSRIVEKEKHELQKQVMIIQNDLSATNKKLEAELQRSIYVDKMQFEYEFQIYKEVWSSLVSLRMVTMRLRPTLDYIDPKQSNEDRQRERLQAFAGPFENYRDIIEKNKPFYSPIVYKALADILEKCYGESIDFEYAERDSREYFKEARKNEKQIVEAIDFACEAIRNRINEIKIV